MESIVTCYWQEPNGKVKYQTVSKTNVSSFIEEHQHVSCVIVCDPRSRTNTTYHYGKVQNVAS